MGVISYYSIRRDKILNKPFLIRVFSLLLLCLFLLPILIGISTPKNVKKDPVDPVITLKTYSIRCMPEVTPVIPSAEPKMEPTAIPTPTLTPTPAPVFSYTEKELDLLARLIRAEAGIESYKCKLWVGSIVINRIKSDEFPDTLEDVIYQRKPSIQFSTIMYSSKLGCAPVDLPADEDSVNAAKEVLEKGSLLPDDVLVFYANYCDEGWVTSRKTYKVVDTTVFAYIYHK
jgi:hypothetical protein